MQGAHTPRRPPRISNLDWKQMLSDNPWLPKSIQPSSALEKRTSLSMKHVSSSLIFALLFCSVSFAQTTPSNSYKQTLDRLDTLTHEAEPDWRFHSDIPHPEDPAVSDADWGSFTVKNTPNGQADNPEHWTGHKFFVAGSRFPTRSTDMRPKDRAWIST